MRAKRTAGWIPTPRQNSTHSNKSNPIRHFFDRITSACRRAKRPPGADTVAVADDDAMNCSACQRMKTK